MSQKCLTCGNSNCVKMGNCMRNFSLCFSRLTANVLMTPSWCLCVYWAWTNSFLIFLVLLSIQIRPLLRKTSKVTFQRRLSLYDYVVDYTPFNMRDLFGIRWCISDISLRMRLMSKRSHGSQWHGFLIKRNAIFTQIRLQRILYYMTWMG